MPVTDTQILLFLYLNCSNGFQFCLEWNLTPHGAQGTAQYGHCLPLSRVGSVPALPAFALKRTRLAPITYVLVLALPLLECFASRSESHLPHVVLKFK